MNNDQIDLPDQSSRRSEYFNPSINYQDRSDLRKQLSDIEVFFPNFEMSERSEYIRNNSFSLHQSERLSQWKQQRQFANQKKPASNFKINKFLMISRKLKFYYEKIKSNAYIYPSNANIQNYLIEKYLTKSNQRILFTMININKQNFYLPLFKPQGLFLVIWQIQRVFITLFLMWWMPFQKSFQEFQEASILEVTSLVFIIMDIGVKLNREIIDQGIVISRRKLILTHYIKNELLIDIFYIISLAYSTFDKSSQSILLSNFFIISLFFLNIIKFKEIIKQYQETFYNQSTFTELFNLVELLTFVYFFAHFIACMWYQVGIISLDTFDISWITKNSIQEQSLSGKYFYSFYWATTTMVTVGYGDICAQNLYEVIVATIIMFFSSAVFGFSINSIGIILTNLNNNQQTFKKSLLEINQYMIQNSVPLQLQSKVRNYVKFIYSKETRILNNEMQEIIDKLSANLRTELIYDVQSRAIKQCNFITKNFSEEIQRELSKNLESVSYAPHEQLYEQDQIDHSCLYILLKGQVSLIDQNSQKVLQTYSKGDPIGYYEFLGGQKRLGTAVANTFSSLYRIPRYKFLEMLKQHPRDLEHFNSIKDEYIFGDKLVVKCYACQQDHTIWQCKYLFYKPSVEKLIKKDLFHSFQDRIWHRRQRPKYSTMLDVRLTQDICLAFREIYFEANNIKSQTYLKSIDEEYSQSVLEQPQDYNVQTNALKLDIENNQRISEENLRKVSQNLISYEEEGLRRQKIRQNLTKIQNKRMSVIIKNLPEQRLRRSLYNQNFSEDKYRSQQIDQYRTEPFILIDTDSQFNFINYQVRNNFNEVIKFYDKYIKKKNNPKRESFKAHSNYAFINNNQQI